MKILGRDATETKQQLTEANKKLEKQVAKDAADENIEEAAEE